MDQQIRSTNAKLSTGMLRRDMAVSSLKIFYEDLTSVKNYGKTNLNIFVLSMGNIQVGFNFFWPVYLLDCRSYLLT